MATVATLSRLAALSDLPASGGSQAVFSPDGNYVALAASVTPFSRVYKRSGDTFTSLGNFSSGQPTVNTYKPEWHSDSSKLILNWLNGSNYQNQYTHSGDVFSLQLAALGTQSGAIRVSADRTMVFCFLQISPWLRIFNLNSDGTIGLQYALTWSGGTPTTALLDGAVSSDIKKVVLGMSSNANYVRVYDVTAINTTAATITLTMRTASSDQTAAASVNNMKFHPDNKHLAVSQNSATSGQAGARIYNIPDTVGSAYTLANLITGFSATDVSRSVSWNSDGTILLAAYASNIKLIPYNVSNDTYGMYQSPDIPPVNVTWADISQDGNYVAVAASAAPVLVMFKVTYATDNLTITLNTSAASIPAATVVAQAISPDGVAWGVVANSTLSSYLRSGTAFGTRTQLNSGFTYRVLGWSPDSKWFVTTTVNNSGLTLCSKNGTTVAVTGTSGLSGAYGIAWTPDSQYYAISIGTGFALYKINSQGNNFAQVTGLVFNPSAPANVVCLVWTPNQKYLIVLVSSAPYVRVFAFDGVKTFTEVTQTVTLSMSSPHSIDITSDGSFIAILGNNNTSCIYAFDQVNGVVTGNPTLITNANNALDTNSQTGSGGKAVKWFPGVGNKAYLAYISNVAPYVHVGAFNVNTKLFYEVSVPANLGYVAAGNVSLTSDGQFLTADTHTSAAMNWFSTNYTIPVSGNGNLVHQKYGQAITTKMKFKANGNELYPKYGMSGNVKVPIISNGTLAYTGKYGIQALMGAFPKEYPDVGKFLLHTPIKVSMTTATISQADPGPFVYSEIDYQAYGTSGQLKMSASSNAELIYGSYSLSGVGGTIDIDGELNYLPYSLSALLNDMISVDGSAVYGLYSLSASVKMTNKIEDGSELAYKKYGILGESLFAYSHDDILLYPSGYSIDGFAYQQLIDGELLYPAGYGFTSDIKLARDLKGDLAYQKYSISAEMQQWYVEGDFAYGKYAVNGDVNVPLGVKSNITFQNYFLDALFKIKCNIDGDLLYTGVKKFSLAGRVGFTAPADVLIKYQKYQLAGASGRPPNVEDGMSPYPTYGIAGSGEMYFGWDSENNIKVRLSGDSDLKRSPRNFVVLHR